MSQSFFLSYAREDREIATQICDWLVQVGANVWMDQHQILPGAQVAGSVMAGIETADYFLVVLSANAVASKWVTREIETAITLEIERGRPLVVPVRVGNVVLPTTLLTHQWINLDDGWKEGLQRLLGPPHQEDQAKPLPPVASAVERRWWRPRMTRPQIILGVVVLGVTVLFVSIQPFLPNWLAANTDCTVPLFGWGSNQVLESVRVGRTWRVWINPQSTATVTARACLDTMDSEQTIDRPTLWYRPVPSGGVAPLPPQECPLWGSVASCQIPIGGRIFVSAATNMGVSLNTGGIQTAEVDYEAAFDAFLPESRKVDRSDLGIDYWKAGAAPALSEELKEPPGDFGTPMSPDSLNVPPDPIQPGGEPEGGRSEY